MSFEGKYQIERAKWDVIAMQELPTSSILPPGEDFYRYAQRISTMAGITDFLGNLLGKRVLEYGCGLGQISTRLAKSGAEVTAFDLSAASVAVTHRRVALNNMEANVYLAVANAESLPYADEAFDVVIGKAILHHLDVAPGWFELYRVLKSGGKAAFVEPMGMNPILNFAREHVPYPHKKPRGADCPLKYREIHGWGKQFRQFRYQEIQLLSMLERGLGFNKRLRILRRMDDVLLRCLPSLRRYCRYVVMFMVK